MAKEETMASFNTNFWAVKLLWTKLTLWFFSISYKHLEDEFLFLSPGNWHRISGALPPLKKPTDIDMKSPARLDDIASPSNSCIVFSSCMWQKAWTPRGVWIHHSLWNKKVHPEMHVFFQNKNYQENTSFESLGDYFLLNSTDYLVAQVGGLSLVRLHFTRVSGTVKHPTLTANSWLMNCWRVMFLWIACYLFEKVLLLCHDFTNSTSRTDGNQIVQAFGMNAA